MKKLSKEERTFLTQEIKKELEKPMVGFIEALFNDSALRKELLTLISNIENFEPKERK